MGIIHYFLTFILFKYATAQCYTGRCNSRGYCRETNYGSSICVCSTRGYYGSFCESCCWDPPVTCPSQYTNTEGVIKSRNYPNPYNNNENCEYRLRLSGTVGTLKMIQLVSYDFKTECCCDRLEILDHARSYQGNSEVQNSCGNGNGTMHIGFNYTFFQEIRSASENFRLQFNTDGSVNDRGFSIFYKITGAGVCDNNPCLNGGTCIEQSNNQYTCQCVPPYTGDRCERSPAPCNNTGEDLPERTFILQGNFTSEGGQTWTFDCISAYSSQLTTRSGVMAQRVNALLPDLICTSLPFSSDSYFQSLASSFAAISNTEGRSKFKGILENSFTQPIVTTGGCASNISLYLQDHANWDPVLDKEENCPAVIWSPDFFWEIETGYECEDSSEGQDGLFYKMQVEGEFSSTSAIDEDCNDGFSENFQQSTRTMKDQVNVEISEGRLCTNTSGYLLSDITVVSSASTGGNLLRAYATFFLNLNNLAEGVRFCDVSTCAGQIFDYLMNGDNWSLTQPTDCPPLTLVNNRFRFERSGYAC